MSHCNLYNIPFLYNAMPINLFLNIFIRIFVEMIPLTIVVFAMYFLALTILHLPVLYSILRLCVYFFLIYLGIAIHESGHAIMTILEYNGIVSLIIGFKKNGVLTTPFITDKSPRSDIRMSKIITLGGLVATFFFNPLINMLIYVIMLFVLPKDVLPDFLIISAIPALMMLFDFFSNNKNSDTRKLKRLYSKGSPVSDMSGIFVDIWYIIKNSILYFTVKNQYYSSLSKIRLVKKTDCGILSDGLLIVYVPEDKNNGFRSLSITNEDIAIWFAINDNSTIGDIVERFGKGSIRTIIEFNENNVITIGRI